LIAVAKLKLPTVTLCAATSVNIEATLAAIAASMDQIVFAEVLLFTDSTSVQLPAGVIRRSIAPLCSGRSYSKFLLSELGRHVRTEHCLIIQWDGFVLDAGRWDPAFLEYDYIGASWPQFDDGHNVGNGGFSLRSRRLLQACANDGFVRSHPEDVAICRVNRNFLEREYGIRFADRTTAERFGFERSQPAGPTFGFHGIFNMIPVLGEERFWQLYRTLDDRRTAHTDYHLLMRQLSQGQHCLSRQMRLTWDRAKAFLSVRGTQP
jgi:hypothetical protein